MIMYDEIIEVYEKEEDITKIVERLRQFSFEELKKGNHFYYSVDEKITDFELIKNTFKQFERIKLIRKRKHKSSKKISYDFYYELENKTWVLYAIALDEEKPLLINAFHVKRKFKNFKKSLIKAYKKQLLGS